ncbi:hypothetical protein WMY93_005532 [Mugilogobius chulae]|uniref:Uncharacterized protein n=1 Tax=Mugilogobius chulae TaxID=88201 RepID=A0AAW0PHC8_9GOBI
MLCTRSKDAMPFSGFELTFIILAFFVFSLFSLISICFQSNTTPPDSIARFFKPQKKISQTPLPTQTVPAPSLQSTLSLRLENKMRRNSTRGCHTMQLQCGTRTSTTDHWAPVTLGKLLSLASSACVTKEEKLDSQLDQRAVVSYIFL